MPDVPHFRLPMRLTTQGDFALVEQNSEEEVAQHAAVVLRTPLGSRLMRPSMGLPDTTHLLSQDGSSRTVELVEAQLAEHEPRAEFQASASGASLPDWVDSVMIDVTGVASNG